MRSYGRSTILPLVCRCAYSVRTGIRTARRGPFANGSLLRIKPTEIAARVISIPDRAIASDCNAPRSATRVRQWVFVNLHRFWVNARKLVSTELCEIRNTVRVHGDPVGQRVRRRHVHELYVTSFRHKPTNHVCALHREPKNSRLIEHRSVGVASLIGQTILNDRTGLRV